MDVSTMSGQSGATTVLKLPRELLVEVISVAASVYDIARLDCACSSFREVIEDALRLRATRAGTIAVTELPPNAVSWTQQLCFDELRRASSYRGRHFAISHGCVQSSHVALVDHEGSVLTCGVNIPDGNSEYFPEDEDGEVPIIGLLGRGDCPSQYHPARVPGFTVRVDAVSVNTHSTLILGHDGVVYSCGGGCDGQLGHGDRGIHLIPKAIQALLGKRIVAIAAGRSHSLFVDAVGIAYSCGEGFGGNLGHGNQARQLTPIPVRALRRKRICAVAASEGSFFLDDAGVAYSCGQGGKGYAGTDDGGLFQLTPRSICGALLDKQICAIAAGGIHTIFLDTAGVAYSCGFGGEGRLGHGDELRQDTPKPIDALRGTRICAIAAGGSASFFVDMSGVAYSCGSGPLANGREWGRPAPTPRGGPGVLAPTPLEDLLGQRVCAVATTNCRSLILLQDGRMFDAVEHPGATAFGISSVPRGIVVPWNCHSFQGLRVL